MIKSTIKKNQPPILNPNLVKIIQEQISAKNEIHDAILNFLDNEQKEEEDNLFQNLVQLFESRKIGEKREDLKNLLYLILRLSQNHHRTQFFFDKIEKIIEYLQNYIKQLFTNFDIFYIFRNSNRILVYLLEKEIIVIDYNIYNYYQKTNLSQSTLFYLYKELKLFYNKELADTQCIEKTDNLSFGNCRKIDDNLIDLYLSDKGLDDIYEEITDLFLKDIDTYDQKRRIGENESYICSLIRNDSIDEFVTYVNSNNVQLSSRINHSNYETNTFINKNKDPTLIEYAAFFGSIQIFNYLRFNGVPLTYSLWLYSIHGRNADIFHILEENKVDFSHYKKDELLEEAITNYILENQIKQTNSFKNTLVYRSLSSYNLEFAQHFDDINHIFTCFCLFDYKDTVESLLKQDKNLVNSEVHIKNRYHKLTPLKVCANKNNFEIIEVLLSQPGIEICPFLFHCCMKLREITIPSTVTKINNNAFEGCELLAKVLIPSSVTLIGDYAFQECISLSQITIPSSVASIGKYAFRRCGSLKEITIPSSVTEFGYTIFAKCSSLTSVTILCKLPLIPFFSFEDCSSLTQIEIPDSVTKIERGSFVRCSSLKQITIPPFVTEIGNDAFNGCSSLEEATILSPNANISSTAFSGCSYLKEIKIHSSLDGKLSGIDKKVKVFII